MNVIKKKIKFTVSNGIDLNKSTIKYFEESGFKFIETKDSFLKFERGSLTSNMWTFNPLKWKSEIFIKIIGEEIIANFTIDTIGQIPTYKEEKLWDSFIDNYKNYLADNKFNFKLENSKKLNDTKKNSLKYVGWAFFGAILGGIPAGFIAYFTGIHSIVSIGAVGGAIVLLIKKINDEKSTKRY